MNPRATIANTCGTVKRSAGNDVFECLKQQESFVSGITGAAKGNFKAMATSGW